MNVIILSYDEHTDRHKAGRQLILIDIENLTGTPSPTCEEVETAKASLRQVVPGFDDAQHIVACSHHAAPTVAFAFRSAAPLAFGAGRSRPGPT